MGITADEGMKTYLNPSFSINILIGTNLYTETAVLPD